MRVKIFDRILNEQTSWHANVLAPHGIGNQCDLECVLLRYLEFVLLWAMCPLTGGH